jgi:hypothetical protein
MQYGVEREINSKVNNMVIKDKFPKNPHWHHGEKYDICMGDSLFYDQGGYHTRVPVWIKDNYTGKIILRIGDGKQIGNFHPVWVKINGKEITVEKLSDVK